MFQSNKTEQSIYECLLGFCFNNIFCAATNFGCIDSFLLPNSRNEEMMGDGFGATAAGLFWTVNVCWAHPVISRASAVASSIFFHGVIPGMLLKFLQNRMCRKLKFHIVNIYYCMSGVMNRHCIPGLTMSTFWRELRECPGIIKTMHTGFSVYTYCIMPTPRCWHGRNRTLWFSGKICVVAWMLSVNSNELSKV